MLHYKNQYYTLLILLAIFDINGINSEEIFIEDEDRSDWINPSDMFAEPLEYRKNILPCKERLELLKIENLKLEESLKVYHESPKFKSAEDFKTLIQDLNSTEKQMLLGILKESEKPDKEQTIDCNMKCDDVVKEKTENLIKCEESLSTRINLHSYFKRFIQILMKGLPVAIFKDRERESEHLKLSWQISLTDFNTMTFFKSGNSTLPGEVFRIIENIKILGFEEELTGQEWFELEIIPYATIILYICMAVFCMLSSVYIINATRLSLITLAFYLVIFGFLASFPWNLWRVYKEKIASRESVLLPGISEACLLHDKGWLSQFGSFFKSLVSFSTDECAKYHEKLLIDPIFEVNPGEVIVQTFSKMILEPLHHLGPVIGSFLKGVFQDLPVQLYPIATIVLMLIIILVILTTCGYNINLFHLIRIERPQQIAPQPIAPQQMAPQPIAPQQIPRFNRLPGVQDILPIDQVDNVVHSRNNEEAGKNEIRPEATSAEQRIEDGRVSNAMGIEEAASTESSDLGSQAANLGSESTDLGSEIAITEVTNIGSKTSLKEVTDLGSETAIAQIKDLGSGAVTTQMQSTNSTQNEIEKKEDIDDGWTSLEVEEKKETEKITKVETVISERF